MVMGRTSKSYLVTEPCFHLFEHFGFAPLFIFCFHHKRLEGRHFCKIHLSAAQHPSPPEICAPQIRETFAYKHTETIDFVKK